MRRLLAAVVLVVMSSGASRERVSANSAPLNCAGGDVAHWYRGQASFHIVSGCVFATGRAFNIVLKGPDVVFRLLPDSESRHLMNAQNVRVANSIPVLVHGMSRIHGRLETGVHVRIAAPWVHNLAYGWNELASAQYVQVMAVQAPKPTTSGCGFQSATQPVHVAFCDTFNAPAGTGNRSGDLNGIVWGVSRVTSAVPQGQFYEWYPTQQQLCGGSNVFPNQDVRICNGQLVEAVNDGGTLGLGGQTVLAMYPKQPFDIAGRTGTATFDLGNTTQGFHTAIPEWWYTDQPVPAPYSQASGVSMFPRNGLGVQLGYVCTSNNSPVGVSVSDINVFVNYASPDVTLVRDGCVKQPTTPTQLNHFEIRLSQSSVQVWGTDAGTTTPLTLLAHADNLGLTMTRGLTWAIDAHYNACKFNNQCDHAFVWDNFGFDGPTLPRDLTFDVPEAKIMRSDGGMQLGWQTPSDQNNPLALTIPGVTNVAQAKAALLVLNWYPLGTDSISYSLNGAPWQTQAWPFPDTISWSSRTLAIPVPLSDVHTGNNTLRLATSDGASVANIDLVLVGAGG